MNGNERVQSVPCPVCAAEAGTACDQVPAGQTHGNRIRDYLGAEQRLVTEMGLALGAANEREACAKLVERFATEEEENRYVLNIVAREIRARK